MQQTQDDVLFLDEPLERPDETQWPPDDTEESVVGSEYHQHVIDAARDGLRMAADANGASWRALAGPAGRFPPPQRHALPYAARCVRPSPPQPAP